MIAWRDDDGPVIRAVTDRRGGVGEAPYDGLNLGGHVGDDPATVAANRRLVADELGLPLVLADQVHGAEVLEVTPVALDRPRSAAGGVGEADALVTTLPDVAVGVLVADCTPVLLHDPDGLAVGAAHAGRPGLLAGVVPALVAAMRDLGARRLRAVVGPSICGRCYEVPADLRDAAARLAPAAVARSWTGTPAVDVAAGVVDQLAAAGAEITWVPGCSREHPDLYSYRRDGVTGRFGAFVGRRSHGL